MMMFSSERSFAQKLDTEDPLKKFQDKFYFPEIQGRKTTYFCGHSLGLQPKSVLPSIETELNDWATLAVEGHLRAQNPWVHYYKTLIKTTSKLVGAKPIEVATMNSLTVNLNALLISFYKPTKKRFKIITEHNPFSSDAYALEEQVKLHGLNPRKTIIEIKPRKNESLLRTGDILETIKKNSKETALVLFSGVHYYTGQAFDIKAITEAAHQAGAIAGFDLAHATGNIKLELHKWNVDFAIWCTYKYLNAGPGAVGQLFIHEKHVGTKKIPRLAGWWGHNEKERFLMKAGFKPIASAQGWAQSNDNILSMASLKASLNIFEEAGIHSLIKKSKLLTGYLDYLIRTNCKADLKDKTNYKIKIISPLSDKERGCQLSIAVDKRGQELFEKIQKQNYLVDYRHPDVIRITPIPLYNRFEEVFDLVQFLKECCFHE